MASPDKPAFINEISSGSKPQLKSVPPASVHDGAQQSVLQAKMLKAVEDPKAAEKLKHVKDGPKEGISEAVKQAYLEEKKEQKS